MTDNTDSLKTRTAGTIKWNVIDRLASQVLYAVTGIVLARLLSVADFGMVGAVLIFQTFASLLVDSGFSYALIQKKSPTQTDYSTVLWLNLAIASFLYIALFLCAPLIADIFDGDTRLIPLSRVMFLSFIINASAIVQTNRLMKRMDVKMLAVSNSLGLIVGGTAGIYLAFEGFGAWAIVWQTLILGAVKSLVLWTTQSWRPSLVFSFESIKGFFGVGSRMMMSSFLNTVFLNIYSFFIGNKAGMVSLGYYTQSDKWSKMGVMSIYQVVTSSFLPTLSAVQDDAERFVRACSKMCRLTAYIVFPAILGLICMATPMFHLLFGAKWDASIVLFQLLLLRGIFTVLTGLYNNFMLAKGHAKSIMWLEVLRDTVAIGALIATLPWISESLPGNPVWGLELMMWGQLASALLTFVATHIVASRTVGVGVTQFLRDFTPYFGLTMAIVPALILISMFVGSPVLALALQCIVGGGVYFAVNALAGSKIQRDVIGYVIKR